MRILIIQTAFIGDVALTTPLFAALRRLHPNALFDVVTTPAGAELLAGLTGVTVHALDKKKKSVREGVADTVRSLGLEPFELVFCPHRSPRSLWLGRKVKSSRRIAFRSLWSTVLGYETVPYPAYANETHYVDKVLSLLAPLGVAKVARARPELAVPPADAQSARAKLAAVTTDGKYLVLSPFSVWGTKMWFADRFAQLGAQLSSRYRLPIVLVGSPTPAEQTVGATIAEKITAAGGRALCLVGKTSLGELKEVIRGAKLLVANDSAPVHIAAAFDVPTVAIFGPTVKKWGFFPLATQARVVERESVECRPCHLHGPERCPRGHFRCMDEIQVADVAAAVENILTHA